MRRLNGLSAGRFHEQLLTPSSFLLGFQSTSHRCCTTNTTKNTTGDSSADAVAVHKAGVTKSDEEISENPHIRPYEWPEPSLEEIDISIPQVHLKYMSDLVTSRYNFKTDLWDEIELNRKSFSRGEEEAKKIPAVKFMKNPTVAMTDEEFKELSESHATETKEFKQRNVSKALIEGLEYDDGVLLIDCRTVGEIGTWGIIEGAKVVPAHDMWEAFKMHPLDFEDEFGFPKPKQYDKVVFYCQFGPRSLMAAQIAAFMGWRNVHHFREGYFNWAKQFNRLIRSWWEHDEESGNDKHRQAQFIIGREISRDIAPELNPRIDKEVESLKLDGTRSRGGVKLIAVSQRSLDPNASPPERLLTAGQLKLDVTRREEGEIPRIETGELVDDMSVPPKKVPGNYYDVLTDAQRHRGESSTVQQRVLEEE